MDDSPTQDTLPSGPTSGATQGPAGYRLGELLGRGGMGEVVLATDERIGRDVALKRMRADADGRRFLREARIQARLDHPAIVPVHELGTDADGRPYFTMKRLTGVTLAARIADGQLGQHRLLRAFVEVCNAISLAHARGVIHRDLKPANIMLGDYGAVYVIDWGVAFAANEPEPDQTSSGGRDTETGTMLGTPGYMAPEQTRGVPAAPPADVYALGCILFEILAREPLHPRGLAAVASTLDAPARSPGAAPELDAACLAALAMEPAARPTAAELAERVERYLEGDRDLERRRTLAAELLVKAHAARSSGDRGTAIHAAGRALALDPESEAAALVTSLMLEPPPEIPSEVETKMIQLDHALGRTQWRGALYSFGVFFAFLPFALASGVTSWPWLGGLYAAVVTMMLVAWYSMRSPRPTFWFALAGNALVAAMCTRVAGPLVFVPALLCVQATAMASYPRLLDRPILPLLCVALGFFVPVVLEHFEVIDQTWTIRDESFRSMSSMIHLGGPVTVILAVGAPVVTMVTSALFARSMARARRSAQESVELQAWHLRKLLPPA